MSPRRLWAPSPTKEVSTQNVSRSVLAVITQETSYLWYACLYEASFLVSRSQWQQCCRHLCDLATSTRFHDNGEGVESENFVPSEFCDRHGLRAMCILSGRNLMNPRGLTADAQVGVETERDVALC